jgi:hypothetical protein
MRKLIKVFLIVVAFINLACDRSTNDLSKDSTIPETKVVESETQFKAEGKKSADEAELDGDGKTTTEKGQGENESLTKEKEQNVKESNLGVTPHESGMDWWMTIAIASLTFNVIIISLLIYVIRRKKYHTERKEHYKGRKEYYKKEFLKIQESLKPREIRNSRPNPRHQPIQIKRKQNPPVQKAIEKKTTFEDEKPVEVPLSVHSTEKLRESELLKPITLFAEKATDDKIFTSVSNQKNEHKSIFKLILDNSDSEKAKFEIVDSDFILKMAANSPDTYLYPVCKPENSNQNYSGEIVTTKRGIAHKVDGKWKVNEEDKATIKFQ